MMKKTMCVTGASGFIGHNLVKELANRGHDVVALDLVEQTWSPEFIGETNGQVDFFRADCRKLDEIDKLIEMCDVVFHLAGQTNVQKSIDEPKLDFEHNVLGTHNVIYSSVVNEAKMIFTSSFAVYGDKSTPPISERAPYNPISPYGVSKQIAEHLINSYKKQHDLNATILRLSNVYGPMGLKSVIYNFLLGCHEKEAITVYGTGEQTRDFIFVQDVVEALIASTSAPNGTYNIATGKETSVNKILGILRDIGYDPQIDFKLARKGDINHSYGDASHAKKSFGWEAKVGIKEGMEMFDGWLKERLG